MLRMSRTPHSYAHVDLLTGAKHETMEDRVDSLLAIKRLHAPLSEDPDFVAMFLDEARLAARIHHPNVIQTLDVESSEFIHYSAEQYQKDLKDDFLSVEHLLLAMNQRIGIGSEELLQALTPAQQSRGEALAGEVQGSIRDAVSERPAAAPSGPAPALKSALDVKNGGKP